MTSWDSIFRASTYFISNDIYFKHFNNQLYFNNHDYNDQGSRFRCNLCNHIKWMFYLLTYVYNLYVLVISEHDCIFPDRVLPGYDFVY